MDYGHPLQLGVALDHPEAAELAVAAEDAGLDLVIPQAPAGPSEQESPDPAAPGELDPWTLLSWVAGRTERVALAAPALSSPYPAVLARAAASLDLLSRGRLSLVLGTPEHASSVDRLTALEETVDVVRGIWSASPTGFSYRGDHHVLDGAARGPAPAHNIAIWLAGSGEVLDLVARTADGWSTSPADLRDGNAAIDSAASAVGRDPREIRRMVTWDRADSTRLLTGGTADAVAELAARVVEDGAASLVLSVDAALLARFVELAPDLREAVATERAARGTVVGTMRSSAVRAARRPGIDYDGLPAALAREAVEPGDAPYATVRSTYLRGGRPGLVLRPADPDEVVEALAFARVQDVPLSVRSGGHGISGRSTNDGGIVIDLSRLNRIDVLNESTRLVRVEPGARWGEVAAHIGPLGWAISSGDFGGVGAGGLATAGGIGFLGRAHGLTIDRVRAVEMVLADGSRVRADAETNPDLFWAARGAGFTMGIATAFEIEAAPVGDVGFAQLIFDASDTADFLVRWAAVVQAAPRELTSFLTIGAPRDGQVVAQTMTVIDSADPERIVELLQPMATIAPLLGQAVQVVPYQAVVQAPPAMQYSEGEPVTRSGLLAHVTPEFAAGAERLIRSRRSFFFQIRALGGATADVAPEATAFAHRWANFSVVAFGANRGHLDAAWDQLGPFEGSYLSFETDPRPERLPEAFPPATLARLREVKRRYDPDNVFRDNTPIAR